MAETRLPFVAEWKAHAKQIYHPNVVPDPPPTTKRSFALPKLGLFTAYSELRALQAHNEATHKLLDEHLNMLHPAVDNDHIGLRTREEMLTRYCVLLSKILKGIHLTPTDWQYYDDHHREVCEQIGFLGYQ